MLEKKLCLNSTTSSHTTFCPVSGDSVIFSSEQAIWAQIFTISALIVSCLLFNSLMLYAIYRTSSHRPSASSILLTNLAVVNVLVGILVLPFWIISTASLGWILPYYFCELTAFITMTLMQCSIFFLSAIAVDRHCSIQYPLRYPIIATNVRVGLVVLMIWALCLLVASFPLYGWGRYQFQPQTIPICNPVYHDDISYTIFLILFGMALPFSLMLVSYVKIVQIARGHIRRIHDSQKQLAQTSHSLLVGNRNQNNGWNSIDTSKTAINRVSQACERRNVKSKFARNLKTVRRVFIAVVAFFFCWGPYIILNFWFVNHDTVPVPYSADLFTTLMAFANSTVNPVIFILLNKDYRRAVRRLAARVFRCCPTNAVVSLSDVSDNATYVPDRMDVNYARSANLNGKVNNSFCHNDRYTKISIVSKSGDTTEMFNRISEPEQSSSVVQSAWNTGKFDKTASNKQSCGIHKYGQSSDIAGKQPNRSISFDKISNCERFKRTTRNNTVTSLSTEPVKHRQRTDTDDTQMFVQSVLKSGHGENNNTNKHTACFRKRICKLNKPNHQQMKTFCSLEETIPGTVID